MQLFYAMGGGWGHLTRTKAIIKALNITDYMIFTANSLVFNLFPVQNILFVEPDIYDNISYANNLIINIIEKHYIQTIFIDVFSVGIKGELTALFSTKNLKVTYISRRLKWDKYKNYIGDCKIRFAKTYITEPLEQPHYEFITNYSDDIEEIKPEYPKPNPERILHLIPNTTQPIWLIVHGFDNEELSVLINYAKDIAKQTKTHPKYLVISDQKIDLNNDFVFLSYNPANDFFPVADKIITGCGFNSMQQLLDYRDKHLPFPFPRYFDDQHWRLNYHKQLNYCTLGRCF